MNKFLGIWGFIRKHKYFITVAAFAAIIGFLDENSLLKRAQYDKEIRELKKDIEKYRAEYEESTEMLNELTTNPEAIERIAREKYLMKKDNEDIFIFE